MPLVFLSLAAQSSRSTLIKDDDDRQADRLEWFYTRRALPSGRIPPGARTNAIAAIRRIELANRTQKRALMRLGVATNGNWTSIGPQPTSTAGGMQTAGRVNAIAVDPRDNNVVYIGAAEGGVWKTTDGGQNWLPITDDEPSLATGVIELDPSNPDTIWVGTGEENFAYDSYYGAGLLKSTDGGQTWTNIPGPFVDTMIGALAISPADSKILLVGNSVGIWRSADAGSTWRQTLKGASATSVLYDPIDGNTAYAALGSIHGNSNNGVYKSTDGGQTWTQLTGSGANSLPTSSVGRIALAMAPSTPSTLYAQIADSDAGVSFGTLLGLYKSTDSGATWNQLSTPSSAWGNQLWYDNIVTISPTNPNFIVIGGVGIITSNDGGSTWKALPGFDVRGPQHVDQHAAVFTSDGSKLYVANDGGVVSASNITSANISWTNLNTTLSLTQFYPGLAVDSNDPTIAIGGTQDNGTQYYNGGVSWTNPIICGDAGHNLIDPSQTGLIYGVCYYTYVWSAINVPEIAAAYPVIYGIDQTDRTSFMPPLAMDPSNPQALYFGTYRVWRTLDGAGRWSAISGDLTKSTVETIAVAPSDPNTIYVGALDGKIQVTTNALDSAGATWTDRAAGNLPKRAVTHIAVDPLDPQTAYACFSGFKGSGIPGHIFQTHDGGASWNDISSTLPDIPVNDLAIDPDAPGAMYAATDAGMMFTTDGGATWSTLGSGLPRVVVLSLVLHRKTRTLRAATHGRGAWDLPIPLTSASVQPLVSNLSPSTVNAGNGDLDLNVTGSNFLPGAVVRWNGQPLSTTVADGSHLVAHIPGGNVAQVGRAAIDVFENVSGAGVSNSMNFAIGPAPSINTGGVINAANALNVTGVAQGSIVSLYGANLAPSISVADAEPPLPYTLNGTSVTIAGAPPIPLFFVSPNQINFQVPWGHTLVNAQLRIAVRQGTMLSSLGSFTLVPFAPVLFTTNQQGTGQAAALIAGTAIIPAPIGAFPQSRPVKAGEYVELYGTGLGLVSNTPQTGDIAPSNPLASVLTKATVNIGGQNAPVVFAGLAPGFVGLYQIDAQVPSNSSGSAVPVTLTIGGVTSNRVTIAIE